jgi:hypothetical protein
MSQLNRVNGETKQPHYFYAIAIATIFLAIEALAIIAIAKRSQYGLTIRIQYFLFFVPVFAAEPLFQFMKFYKAMKALFISQTDRDLLHSSLKRRTLILALHCYISISVLVGVLFALMALLRRS